MLIKELFRALASEPALFLNAKKGSEFEDRIMNYLKTDLPFTRYMPDEARHVHAIKETVLREENEQFIKNTTEISEGFVYQPYGTQSYPDLLVFDNDFILPIEIKFSTKSKGRGEIPMWNGGLPRLNGIYVYGSLPRKSIAVFYGADIISKNERKELLYFFNGLTKQTNEFNSLKMKNQQYGFIAYTRKAFNQQKNVNPEAKTSLIDERKNLYEKLISRFYATLTANKSTKSNCERATGN